MPQTHSLLKNAPPLCLSQVELLQLGPKGDLVVGSSEIRILSLVNKGTVIQWLDLKAAFNQTVGAQLCCVLRYLSGEDGTGDRGSPHDGRGATLLRA